MRAFLRKWWMACFLLVILLSPRFSVGQLPHGRAIDVRIDDILIVVAYLFWQLRVLMQRRKIALYKPPIFYPLMAYIAIAIVTTETAILVGDIDTYEGNLYLLKEIEFFLIFLLVANNLSRKEQISALIAAFIISGLANMGWVAYQMVTGMPFTSYGPAPVFEGGSAVHSGAMSFFPMAISLSLLVYTRGWKKRLGLGLLVCLFLAGLLLSGSRSFFVGAFVGMLLLSALIKRTSVSLLLIITTVSCSAAILMLPPMDSDSQIAGPFLRYQKTLNEMVIGSVAQDNRVAIWYDSLALWQSNSKTVILGAGEGIYPTAGGAHSIYLRVLTETGMLGFAAFMFAWLLILRTSFKARHLNSDPLFKAVALACLFVTLVFSIVGFSADVLRVVRIAGPYWVLVGILMSICKRSTAKRKGDVRE